MVLAVATIVLYFLFGTQTQNPPAQLQLHVSLVSPPAVTVTEPFEMAVAVRNTRHHPIVLDSIYLPRDFLHGFEVLGTSPSSVQPFDVDVFDQQGWFVGETLGPDDDFRVTIKLKPTALGTFSGYLEVCSPNRACEFIWVLVDVKPRDPLQNNADAA